MKRLLALLLTLLLPLYAHGDDSRRWVEDISKLKELPLADEARLDAGFSRPRVENAADALGAALLWADADALDVPGAALADYSAFVMAQNGAWLVTLCTGMDTVLLQIDADGRLLSLTPVDPPELPAYTGMLPRDTYTAIRSYIEHFARMNGCRTVTDYARVGCAWSGEGYDVRVTVRAALDGTPCEFTLSLATMGFTAISCPLPPVERTSPPPMGMEQFVVTVDHRLYVVEALDKRSRGDAFSPWPADAMSREAVFSAGLTALTKAYGFTVEDLTLQPFSYGYDAESAVGVWQLDFYLRDTGEGYTVHIRDVDGAVMGVWAPEEANG